jgi:hypothetical protein
MFEILPFLNELLISNLTVGDGAAKSLSYNEAPWNFLAGFGSGSTTKTKESSRL